MSEVNKAEFLFSIGNIMIYEMKSKGLFSSDRPTYFWKLKDNPDINGPFTSIFEATRHWEWTTMNPPAIPNNVIRVDFKNKRRIK